MIFVRKILRPGDRPFHIDRPAPRAALLPADTQQMRLLHEQPADLHRPSGDQDRSFRQQLQMGADERVGIPGVLGFHPGGRTFQLAGNDLRSRLHSNQLRPRRREHRQHGLLRSEGHHPWRLGVGRDVAGNGVHPRRAGLRQALEDRIEPGEGGR